MSQTLLRSASISQRNRYLEVLNDVRAFCRLIDPQYNGRPEAKQLREKVGKSKEEFLNFLSSIESAARKIESKRDLDLIKNELAVVEIVYALRTEFAGSVEDLIQAIAGIRTFFDDPSPTAAGTILGVLERFGKVIEKGIPQPAGLYRI